MKRTALTIISASLLLGATAFAAAQDNRDRHGGGAPHEQHGGGGHHNNNTGAEPMGGGNRNFGPRSGGESPDMGGGTRHQRYSAPSSDFAPREMANPEFGSERHNRGTRFGTEQRSRRGSFGTEERRDNRGVSGDEKGNRHVNNMGRGMHNARGFGTRPPNANNRPRNFDRATYQHNVTATHRFHNGAYRRPEGWSPRRWRFGEILPHIFFAEEFWLSDWWLFDLPIPPYGYEWVRYGDDALLVNIDTGEILEVEYGVFY